MESRRSFVVKVATGALTFGVLGGIVRTLTHATNDDAPNGPAMISSDPPWHLLEPLGPGAELGHGWRLASLSGIHAGSFVVTLAHRSGRSQRVRICRNDGKPDGIVSTATCDLLIMNAGSGLLPTEEALAQAVAGVGRAISHNEGGGNMATTVAALLSHKERTVRFSRPVQEAG